MGGRSRGASRPQCGRRTGATCLRPGRSVDPTGLTPSSSETIARQKEHGPRLRRRNADAPGRVTINSSAARSECTAPKNRLLSGRPPQPKPAVGRATARRHPAPSQALPARLPRISQTILQLCELAVSRSTVKRVLEQETAASSTDLVDQIDAALRSLFLCQSCDCMYVERAGLRRRSDSKARARTGDGFRNLKRGGTAKGLLGDLDQR